GLSGGIRSRASFADPPCVDADPGHHSRSSRRSPQGAGTQRPPRLQCYQYVIRRYTIRYIHRYIQTRSREWVKKSPVISGRALLLADVPFLRWRKKLAIAVFGLAVD